MLEREYGGKGKGKGLDVDENVVGSVDGKGRIITDGPKKRAVVRWIQVLFALIAGGSSIYAGLVSIISTCIRDFTLNASLFAGYQNILDPSTRRQTTALYPLYPLSSHLPILHLFLPHLSFMLWSSQSIGIE